MRLTQYQRRQMAQHRTRRAVRRFLQWAADEAALDRIVVQWPRPAGRATYEAAMRDAVTDGTGCVVLTYDPGANWLADVNRFLSAASPSARTH